MGVTNPKLGTTELDGLSILKRSNTMKFCSFFLCCSFYSFCMKEKNTKKSPFLIIKVAESWRFYSFSKTHGLQSLKDPYALFQNDIYWPRTHHVQRLWLALWHLQSNQIKLYRSRFAVRWVSGSKCNVILIKSFQIEQISPKSLRSFCSVCAPEKTSSVCTQPWLCKWGNKQSGSDGASQH